MPPENEGMTHFPGNQPDLRGHLTVRSVLDRRLVSIWSGRRELQATLTPQQAERVADTLRSPQGLVQIMNCAQSFEVPASSDPDRTAERLAQEVLDAYFQAQAEPDPDDMLEDELEDLDDQIDDLT